MQHLRSFVLTLIAALFLQIVPVSPAWSASADSTPALRPLANNTASAVLMDAYSGKILLAKEPHKHVVPASVTKIATMLVVMDAITSGKAHWNDQVVASESACNQGGSQIFLKPGEKFSLRELMIAIAVESANDSCVAVAEHIAGSQEAFVGLMNQKARSLGLKDTHFVNTNGLPAEGHYTSAYDMSVLARESLKYPDMLQLTSIKRYDKLRNGHPILINSNRLLWLYRGADGLKTGWTTEAKYCLVSTVQRDHLRLICSVFGVPELSGQFQESIKLYDWGYANYSLKEPVTAKNAALLTSHRIGVLVKKMISRI
jgi:D-alanyl-D-alanine carboxypeptidase (penicillin-binding protein 5/6)